MIEQNKTLDNFNTSISRGDVCALVNRQDTPINSLINWSDINQTFRNVKTPSEEREKNDVLTIQELELLKYN